MVIAIREPEFSTLAEGLARGLVELGIELSAVQQGQLLDYLGLLEKWNAVYNLTAVREPARMLALHLLDSLAVLPLLRELDVRRVLDVGSGAGLPGIPLAIALPSVSVTLVDSVQKKVSFLNQVKGELHLPIVPLHTKVQALTSAIDYDCIVSRAFSSIRDFVEAAAHLLAPGGVLVALKSRAGRDELADLPATFVTRRVVDLHVPGLGASRCAIVIAPASASGPSP